MPNFTSIMGMGEGIRRLGEGIRRMGEGIRRVNRPSRAERIRT